MARHKLLPALFESYRHWKRENKRYSWLYCPLCHYDLNGDEDSFVKEDDDKMRWHFKCPQCSCTSTWHLYGMVPMVESQQVLTVKEKKVG